MKPIIIALTLMFVAVSASANDQRKTLPCEAIGIVVAVDGSGLWFSCSEHRAAEKRAQAAGDPTPPVGSRNDPTAVYWLSSGPSTPVKIATAAARIWIFAAPRGSQALLVVPQEGGKDKVVLYDRQQRVKELPVDAAFLLWSADARKVYFYGGTTRQADAWNILAVYDLNSGAVQRRRLREPTEIIEVCLANGNLYAVTPAYPGFPGSTVEYTADVAFVRQVRGWIGAHFSATCSYVASEADYHGPLPWKIYEVNSGKALVSYIGLDDEGELEAYRFVEWNPAHDSWLLREHILGKGRADLLEVFDVNTKQVLFTLPDTDVVAWSADGNSVVVGDKDALVWNAISQARSSAN